MVGSTNPWPGPDHTMTQPHLKRSNFLQGSGPHRCIGLIWADSNISHPESSACLHLGSLRAHPTGETKDGHQRYPKWAANTDGSNEGPQEQVKPRVQHGETRRDASTTKINSERGKPEWGAMGKGHGRSKTDCCCIDKIVNVKNKSAELFRRHHFSGIGNK